MRRHTNTLSRIIRKYFRRQRRIVGVELGVWKGQNAADLLDAWPQLILYLVDAFDANHQTSTRPYTQEQIEEVRDEFDTLFADIPEWRYLLLEMTTHRARQYVFRQFVDFVFVDAGHDYESVRQDIALWWPKVRAGGVLCGHDYNGRSDRKGVFGVKRAVDEAFPEGVKADKASLVWWIQK